jgi:cathepsin L
MKLFVLACLVALTAAAPAVQDLEWESWKQEHSKKYEDDDTETKRYGIWLDNMAFIEKHNSEGHSFTVGMNAFGDLTTDEIVQMYNGYVAPQTNSSLPAFKASPDFVPLETVDWREKGAVTPVKNQGQCGSCWAFSATGSLEGQHFLKDGRLVSLSEQNLIDCSKKEGNNGCKGGLMDRAFKYIIENGGIDTEASYPYQAHDELCRFREMSVGATMTSYRDVERGSQTALTEAITRIGPISAAMDAHLQTFHFYKRGVYNDPKCSSTKLDHGILPVGYGIYEGQEYYLVKNSWGPAWGNEGYFMIARGFENMCGLATQASYPIV